MSETPQAAPVTERSFVYLAIMWLVMYPVYRLYFRARVRGLEHLPRQGGALIAANHQSFLDIPLIAKAAAPRHVSFVARHTLANSRVLGFVMRSCGAILIERGKGDRAAVRSAVQHLEHEDLVAIFPEGTRTRDGTLGEFKKGALLAARKAGRPIVPCAILGSYEALPRGVRFPRPRRLELWFGPPVDPGSETALEEVQAAVARLLKGTSLPSERESTNLSGCSPNEGNVESSNEHRATPS